MDSARLISSYEHCNREGFWNRDREKQQPDDKEMLYKAIHVGVTTTRADHGEAAGEECFGMGATCGLQTTTKHSVHDQVLHLSCLSDIISVAVRKASEPPWGIPPPIQLGKGPTWASGAYLAPSGTSLRRIALVSNWSDDLHFHECRAWHTLGEVCAFGLPMQLVVAVIGSNKSGKRHSYWSHALRHPANRTLKFRKRVNVETPFKSTWREAWREDWDDLSTTQWLEAMLGDDVLRDVFFKIDVPVPEAKARKRIVDLASRRLEEIASLQAVPDQQLSTCDWPRPCIYRNPCHSNQEPNGRFGFVKIDPVQIQDPQRVGS